MYQKNNLTVMWMDQQVSLYNNVTDTVGTPCSIREILFTKFGRDFPAIYKLRKMGNETPDAEKKNIKDTLQLYSPSALMVSRKAKNVIEINRSGIMQLDFDYKDIQEYDVTELKQCVYSLPFIAFCGLSCSGTGFYALAVIAEPERLSEYAEHCFKVFMDYGIKADTSKGRNPQDLRFVSYDANMLIREKPEPLRIGQLKAKQAPKKVSADISQVSLPKDGDRRLNWGLKALREVMVGNRFTTVRIVAYSLGGTGNKNFLDDINQAIKNIAAFDGDEDEFINVAKACFNDGMNKPF